MIPPTSSRYSAVPHHKEWHHLGDDLACQIEEVKNFRVELGKRANERSDSPEFGFEGMFFAWGTVL